MADYHGPAQRLHPALSDSYFWSHPSHTLLACDVNNSMHSALSLSILVFFPDATLNYFIFQVCRFGSANDYHQLVYCFSLRCCSHG